MRSKKATMAAMILLVSLMSTGCAANTTQAGKDGKYYTVDIDGNRNSVDEDDLRVTTLIDQANGYLDATVARNYNNDSYLKEYDYYTKEVYQQRMDSNMPDAVKESITKNKVETTLNSTEFESIQFLRQHGLEVANVNVVYVSTMKCNEDYAQSLSILSNTPYQRTISIVFVLEDGEWKVSSYTTGPRTQVN